MQTKPDNTENHASSFSVLVIAGHSGLRSGLEALLRSVRRIENVYVAGDHADAEAIIDTRPIHLVLLGESYLRSTFSKLLNRTQNKHIHVVALDDWDNDSHADDSTGRYLVKGVGPEQLVAEIQEILFSRNDANMSAKT